MKDFITSSPSLSFSEALNSAIKNIFNISGRARRSEFWWVMLVVHLPVFIPLLGLLWFIVAYLLTIPLKIRRLHDTGRSGWWYAAGFIMAIIWLIFMITDVVRLISAVPYGSESENIVISLLVKNALFVGLFVLYDIVKLVFYCTDSNPYANKYGESPKYCEKMEDQSAIKM